MISPSRPSRTWLAGTLEALLQLQGRTSELLECRAVLLDRAVHDALVPGQRNGVRREAGARRRNLAAGIRNGANPLPARGRVLRLEHAPQVELQVCERG